MYNLTLFKADKHYEQLVGIWKQYDWVAPDLSVLPDTGYVMEIDGLITAACFVYESNSRMCFLDWIIADPDVSREVRNRSVSDVIEFAIKKSKQNGYTHFYTVTANNKLVERLASSGFQLMESGATSLVFSSGSTDFLKG